MAAIGVSSKVHYTYVDHSGETTRLQLHFDPIDVSGDNSALLAALTGKIKLMESALFTVTKVAEGNITVSIPWQTQSPSLPTDATAQRETAIRWIYGDTVTGKKYRFDLPAPVDAIVPTGSDDVNMAALDVVAFKAVFDANVLSEVGNPVTLLSGRFVGRRN